MPTTGIVQPPEDTTLIHTLADATPAFSRRPIPVTPDMSVFQRLILALADATPAFVPNFDTDEARGPRPWYRHPISVLVTVGIMLGIPAAALIALPDSSSVTGTTPPTAPPTSSPLTSAPMTATTTAPETGTAETAPPAGSSTPAGPAPSTTTVTATQTSTATVTETTPTVTETEIVTVTTAVTTTVVGPAATQTSCLDGSTAIDPDNCPAPPTPTHPSLH